MRSVWLTISLTVIGLHPMGSDAVAPSALSDSVCSVVVDVAAMAIEEKSAAEDGDPDGASVAMLAVLEQWPGYWSGALGDQLILRQLVGEVYREVYAQGYVSADGVRARCERAVGEKARRMAVSGARCRQEAATLSYYAAARLAGVRRSQLILESAVLGDVPAWEQSAIQYVYGLDVAERPESIGQKGYEACMRRALNE